MKKDEEEREREERERKKEKIKRVQQAPEELDFEWCFLRKPNNKRGDN